MLLTVQRLGNCRASGMEALLGELPSEPVERLRLAAVGGNVLTGVVCLVATVSFGRGTFAGATYPTLFSRLCSRRHLSSPRRAGSAHATHGQRALSLPQGPSRTALHRVERRRASVPGWQRASAVPEIAAGTPRSLGERFHGRVGGSGSRSGGGAGLGRWLCRELRAEPADSAGGGWEQILLAGWLGGWVAGWLGGWPSRCSLACSLSFMDNLYRTVQPVAVGRLCG
eukprot:COSAG02_NODE_3188_length_7205_cov_25.313538_2_plen_227_part_00